jgi:predicted adenylyl cyclase CyaB
VNELRRNIELKARLRESAGARAVAESLADRPVELQMQCDTYFNCPHGRLKLREIEGQSAQLIWYDRADRAEAKESDYRLVDVADSKGLLAALTAALGVRSVVRKRRRIYWHRNVRIHLDDVDGTGSFLEFEAVLSDPADEPASRQLVDELARQFDLKSDDLLRGSYGDMLAGLAADAPNPRGELSNRPRPDKL